MPVLGSESPQSVLQVRPARTCVAWLTGQSELRCQELHLQSLARGEYPLFGQLAMQFTRPFKVSKGHCDFGFKQSPCSPNLGFCQLRAYGCAESLRLTDASRTYAVPRQNRSNATNHVCKPVSKGLRGVSLFGDALANPGCFLPPCEVSFGSLRRSRVVSRKLGFRVAEFAIRQQVSSPDLRDHGKQSIAALLHRSRGRHHEGVIHEGVDDLEYSGRSSIGSFANRG